MAINARPCSQYLTKKLQNLKSWKKIQNIYWEQTLNEPKPKVTLEDPNNHKIVVRSRGKKGHAWSLKRGATFSWNEKSNNVLVF